VIAPTLSGQAIPTGEACQAWPYVQVGTSGGLPVCLYVPGAAVPVGLVLLFKLLGFGWLASLGVGAVWLLAIVPLTRGLRSA
jgi:hypothetical protein